VAQLYPRALGYIEPKWIRRIRVFIMQTSEVTTVSRGSHKSAGIDGENKISNALP
jgi:hypothetical protein